MNTQGRFFAFEGIDGSGKSTQVRRVAQSLQQSHPVHHCAQPSHNPMGQLLRDYLGGKQPVHPNALALLFAGDRLDHLCREDGILWQLSQGNIVLCDRYYFSSFAYQSLEMPMDEVISYNQKARELRKPTATFFLDVPPDLALQRIAQRGGEQELFETKERLNQTYQNYKTAFARFQQEENIIFLQGNRPEEEITAELLEHIRSHL